MSEQQTSTSQAFDMDAWNDVVANGGDPDDTPTPVTEEEVEVPEEAAPVEESPVTEPAVEEPAKTVQTPEENALFAQRRREEQARKQAEDLLKQSPEYKAIEALATQYGMTPADMAKHLQEQVTIQRAQAQGVPVEVVKQIQDLQSQNEAVQRQLQEQQFNAWKGRIDNETAALKAKFPMLSDQDFHDAATYLLNDMRNPDLPLSSAVFALHSEKLLEATKQSSHQEALAEVSNRKQTAVAEPANTAQPQPGHITESERRIARQFGMTDEEWIKSRDMQ